MAQEDNSTTTAPKRPSLTGRHSSASIYEASSPPRRGSGHKLHKAHAAGHGRLSAHARNTSYGKNLSKLAKAVGADARPTSSHSKSSKAQSPTGSPPAGAVKRNSSHVSLPKVNSKTNVKRNSSNLSLHKRNGSGHQLVELAAQRESEARQKKLSNGSAAPPAARTVAGFSVGADDDDNDDDDNEWTEASASQSPNTTRQSSLVALNLKAKPPLPLDEPQQQPPRKLPASPPDSPRSRSPQPQQPRPLNPSVSLLHRNNLHTPLTTTTPLSASGTPTPPPSSISPDPPISQLSQPSMPSNGISRFLQPENASIPSPPPESRSLSPTSPQSSRRVPYTPSITSLSSAAFKPTCQLDPSNPTFEAYTVSPAPRRVGGNTQAKMELWKSREDPRTSRGKGDGEGQDGSSGRGDGTVRGGGRDGGVGRACEEVGRRGEEIRRWREPVLLAVKRVKGIRAGIKGKKTRGRGAQGDEGGEQEEEGGGLDGLLTRMWESNVAAEGQD